MTSMLLSAHFLFVIIPSKSIYLSIYLSNPGGKSPPVICGVNTGQHMYLDASPSCNTLKIDVDTGTATTRQWQIKVDI